MPFQLVRPVTVARKAYSEADGIISLSTIGPAISPWGFYIGFYGESYGGG